MKQKEAATLPLPELSTFLNHSISMDTERRLNTVREGNHKDYETLDRFSNYIVTVPTPKRIAQNAVHPKVITRFQSSVLLNISLQIEEPKIYNSELAIRCTLFDIRHFRRISHVLFAMDLFEHKIRTIEHICE